MKIQRAEIGDLPQIHRLFCDYLVFYKREVHHERVFGFLRARLENGDSTIFLATQDGEALGFVQLYPSFSSLSQSKTWILNDLYVDSKERSRGIGEKLIEAAVAFSKDSGATSLSLQTARDNVTAQRLYEKLGWMRDEDYFTYSRN